MEGTKALKIKSYGKLEIETQNSYIEKTKIVTCWQLFLKQNKCVSSLRNSEKRILTNEFEQGSRKKTSLEGN